MSEATALVRLQEIDLALHRHKKAAEELPQRSQVAASRAAEKKVASKLTHLLGQRKDAEMDLGELEERKAMLEAKVDEVQSEAANGADYHATQGLDAQLSSLAKKLEKVSFDTDCTFERLEALEQSEREAQTLAERLCTQERAQTDAWRSAAAGITQQVKILSAERESVVAQISPALIERYEKAKKRFGGVAVETLNGNRPSACRVTLQPSSFADIMHSANEITTCPYCKRILVVFKED